jgi:nitrate/TMAO reductase-like tetraheme cytochrome c subunit
MVLQSQTKIQPATSLFTSSVQSTRRKIEQHDCACSNVWATMKANDSHECRNCHLAAAMDPHKQTEVAQKVMAEGFKTGLTCIDCHKGVASCRNG